ncbi:hypothetical protein ON010_g17252 [Phytophthora cinnamomi]|nr:hypothetical protein ON010_g17252 [Phytophthora cinnamomi]
MIKNATQHPAITRRDRGRAVRHHDGIGEILGRFGLQAVKVRQTEAVTDFVADEHDVPVVQVFQGVVEAHFLTPIIAEPVRNVFLEPERHVEGFALARTCVRPHVVDIVVVAVALVGTLRGTIRANVTLVDFAERFVGPPELGRLVGSPPDHVDLDLRERPAIVADQPVVPRVEVALQDGLELGRLVLVEVALGVPAHAVVERAVVVHQFVHVEVLVGHDVPVGFVGHIRVGADAVVPDPVQVLFADVLGRTGDNALSGLGRDLAEGGLGARVVGAGLRDDRGSPNGHILDDIGLGG